MIDEKEIAFSEDIARLVSEETGYSKDAVMSHIDFLAHWIKKLTKDPTILNIRFPHVGYLYLNISRVARDVEHFSNIPKEDMNKAWLKMLELNKIRLDTFGKEFDGHTGYNRHKKRTKIVNPYFCKGMDFKQLEKWQNK